MNPESTEATNTLWEEEGRRWANRVQKLSVVLVAGTDAVATSGVALGLARQESERRAVTVADIWGDLPEIERLTSNDDPHGISDHLSFGVSLARLRTPARGNPTLQLIKSGTDDITQESLLSASRWDGIFSSFRNAGALLVLPCHIGTAGLEHLSKRADGVIVVGDERPALLSGIVGVISRVTTPTSTQRSGARRAPRATPFSLHPAAAKRETASEEISPRKSPSAPAAAADGVAPKDTSPWRKVHRWPIAMVVILVILGVIALLLIQGARPDGLSLTSRTRGAATPDSTAAAPGAAELAPLGVINPAAASEASRYAVEIAVLNTRAGADMRLAELREISGSTIAPVVSDDGESWYRVFAGALRTRDSADSLQLELRSRGIQMADGNRVVELPYAIRLAVHPPNAEAAAEVDLARYISLGIPAYLLTQTDGSLTIYAAGFETLEQASHFGEFCASKGIPSRLAYRTGR